MNYLAHLFLSGNDPEIMTGNFIGDHVKGKNYPGFSAGMIKGIELHRAIDHFTDTHPVVLTSKERLRPVFHKYAPVITDIFYDHFLAANFYQYAQTELPLYTRFAYGVMEERAYLLPEKAKRMLSYMIPQNWLLHYASIEGIHKALSGMARRATFESGMEKAAEYLAQDYSDYEKEFALFFPELMVFCKAFLDKET